MRGKKLIFKCYGSQFLETIRDAVEEIYVDSGMKDFGKIKVETFINEVTAELKRREEKENG